MSRLSGQTPGRVIGDDRTGSRDATQDRSSGSGLYGLDSTVRENGVEPLLLHTMAAFASWLVGMACETAGIDQWLAPFRSKRRLYSIMRLGREALLRRWSNARLEELMEQIRKPSPALLDQMAVAA